MAKKVQDKEKSKAKKRFDAGKIFIKVMAGMLALLMVASFAATLVYYL